MGRHSAPATPALGTPFPQPVVAARHEQPAAKPQRAAMKKRRKRYVPFDELPLWRKIVSVIGEIFITIGLFLLLFIVWQVWWTDIGANQLQHEAVAKVESEWGKRVEKIGAPEYSDPPVGQQVGPGEVIGIVHVPRFGLDYAYTAEEGTGIKLLNTGAYGHYENTQQVGEIGNFALAAHRQTYGAPLKQVADLQEGDPIIIETKDVYYVYKVTEDYIVSPKQVSVTYPVPNNPEAMPTERLLTLTTCHPPFVSNQRWIVHAKFDHWVKAENGIPAEMAHEGGAN